MKFKIHYDGAYSDELVIEGDTIEEIKEQAYAESNKRGWETRNCWSEKLD